MTWILFATLAFAAETTVKLNLNWKAEPQFGGFYTASLAKKSPVKFQIQEGGSGTPTVQMLANGQTDFAIVSAEEILISNERNPKNRVIALFAAFQVNPQMIMCHNEKNLKNLQEVFTSNVTLSWQSGLTYAQYLKKRFPPSRIKFVPYTGGVSAFLTDKNLCQQGFATSEPLTAEAAGAKPKVYLVADEGFNPYTTVLAVREDKLLKNPELVKQVVTAVRDGWKDYLNDPTSTNEVMQKLNRSMSSETFRKSAFAQRPFIEGTGNDAAKGLGHMSEDRWLTLAKELVRLNVISKVPIASETFRDF